MSTIKDVAKLAGVSASTVSRTLSGRIFVEEKTRQRVLEAVEELGYRPNILARGLKQGQTYTIAFLVPDINSLFYPQIMKALERAATAKGYSLLLCNNNQSTEQEQRTLERLAARGVDGIACMTVSDEAPHLMQLKAAQNMPLVLINRPLPTTLSSISVDDEQGSYTATRYLLDNGHRRIVALFGSSKHQRFCDRYEGYRRALEECSAPRNAQDHYFDINTVEESYRLALELFRLPKEERPTALYASMDVLAIGIYRAASECGLSVPGDISVVGFDDIEISRYMIPSLTTYAAPIDELAQRSIEALLAQIDEPKTMIREILPGSLIERESVRKLA